MNSRNLLRVAFGKDRDITNLNTGCIKAFQHEILNRPLYPDSHTVSGNFKVKFNKNVKIRVVISSNEEISQSRQQFIISKERILEETPPKFSTYI